MELFATASYRITDGYEEYFSRNELGQKLTTGKFTIVYSGDLVGDSVLMELKNHTHPGETTIYGLERFTGAIFDRKGTVVLEHIGKKDKGQIRVTRKIVLGSGTGDLEGIEGIIYFDRQSAKSMRITLKCVFAESPVIA